MWVQPTQASLWPPNTYHKNMHLYTHTHHHHHHHNHNNNNTALINKKKLWFLESISVGARNSPSPNLSAAQNNLSSTSASRTHVNQTACWLTGIFRQQWIVWCCETHSVAKIWNTSRQCFWISLICVWLDPQIRIHTKGTSTVYHL